MKNEQEGNEQEIFTHSYDPLDNVRERVFELEEQVRRLTLFATCLSFALYYTLSKVVFRDEISKGAFLEGA